MNSSAVQRVVLTALLLCAFAPAVTADVPTLNDCDVLVRDKPREPYSYFCFVVAVRGGGDAEDAVRRLEAILALNPDLHRARLYLGWIEEIRESPRAELLIREAMDGMEAVGDHWGVVYGGTGFSFRLGEEGRIEEAGAQLERAARAADQIGNAENKARVIAGRASLARRTTDHGLAWRYYRQAEALVFPEGPAQLQCVILSGLGGMSWGLGELAKAKEYYRREAEIRSRIGDHYEEASPRYNIALVAKELAWRGEMEESESRSLAEEALAAAIRGRNPGVEAFTRILLAEGLAGEAAIAEFERARAIADMTGELPVRLQALRGLAEKICLHDPGRADEAFRLVDGAIEEARAAGDGYQVTRGLSTRAFITAITRTREEAIEAYWQLLDELDRVRRLQPEETVRARVHSVSSFSYYRLSGFLLRGLLESSAPESDLELAFRTMERLRARVMLDTLSTGATSTEAGYVHLQEERAALFDRIAEVQRRLLDRDLSQEERTSALEELERLEAKEVELSDRIAREDPSFEALHAPSFPTLAEIRESLDEDQALLSFQLWGNNDGASRHMEFGRSWLVAVTHDGARVYELPDRDILEDQVHMFEGLLENRDGSEARAAAQLYDDLLDRALEEMPGAVRKLVVVPDGALYRLPFCVLREHPDSPPLASRYEVSIVPSATLWARWLNEVNSSPPPPRVLALADPEIAEESARELFRMAAPWAEGLDLGRLPFARQEARLVARRVSADSRVLTGREASETFLKRTELGGFGVLHLAAHAVVDEDRPHRSAVLLAAGDAAEDGLLQVREIVDLDLNGKVILLMGCRSATGEVLLGEGVMGLARAFFQAGAVAVVGSLWPLRDDEAAVLMNEFSRGLSRGQSVAAALAGAKRSRIEAGAPAASWAGLVVLGEGDVVPVPGGSRNWMSRNTVLIIGAAVVVFGVLLILLWLRRG